MLTTRPARTGGFSTFRGDNGPPPRCRMINRCTFFLWNPRRIVRAAEPFRVQVLRDPDHSIGSPPATPAQPRAPVEGSRSTARSATRPTGLMLGDVAPDPRDAQGQPIAGALGCRQHLLHHDPDDLLTVARVRRRSVPQRGQIGREGPGVVGARSPSELLVVPVGTDGTPLRVGGGPEGLRSTAARVSAPTSRFSGSTSWYWQLDPLGRESRAFQAACCQWRSIPARSRSTSSVAATLSSTAPGANARRASFETAWSNASPRNW